MFVESALAGPAYDWNGFIDERVLPNRTEKPPKNGLILRRLPG